MGGGGGGGGGGMVNKVWGLAAKMFEVGGVGGRLLRNFS